MSTKRSATAPSARAGRVKPVGYLLQMLTAAFGPIVLQKSKVAAPRIFSENKKRKTIADSCALNRVAELADEFNVRGAVPSHLYTKDAPTARRILDHLCKTTFATQSARSRSASAVARTYVAAFFPQPRQRRRPPPWKPPPPPWKPEGGLPRVRAGLGAGGLLRLGRSLITGCSGRRLGRCSILGGFCGAHLPCRIVSPGRQCGG